jgi:hypothetical protein
MIAGDSFHTCRVESGTTKQIAAADHHPYLHTQADQLTYFYCHSIQHFWVNAEIGITHQSLTAEFEKYPLVFLIWLSPFV